MESLMEGLIKMAIMLSAMMIGVIIRGINWKKRRRRKDIPEDASVLYEDSGFVYFGCAMPFVISMIVLLLLLWVSESMDENAWRVAFPYIIILAVMIGLLQIWCLFVLYMKNKQKILWNENGIWVDSLFHKRRYVRYEDIQKIICYRKPGWTKPPGVIAFGFEEKKLFYATETMTNYAAFLKMLYWKRQYCFVLPTDKKLFPEL